MIVRRSSSSWSSAHALLARGSGRAEGAGPSGVLDRCGHCRSSWWDNGPRHFAESRHHELLGRIHGTRLLSLVLDFEVGWKSLCLGDFFPEDSPVLWAEFRHCASSAATAWEFGSPGHVGAALQKPPAFFHSGRRRGGGGWELGCRE
jgi:hypothetical protein